MAISPFIYIFCFLCPQKCFFFSAETLQYNVNYSHTRVFAFHLYIKLPENVFTPKYWNVLKEKVTLVTFLNFTYFSSYLLTKETGWKWRSDAIFLELELIWGLLGEFWKTLIKIKQLKSSMTVSLTQIFWAVECLGNTCGYLVRTG